MCTNVCSYEHTHTHSLSGIRTQANAIAQDIRRIMRSDTRVMNKLHRRVFVDKITKDDVQIYMSFYLDAANRDAFMAIKQVGRVCTFMPDSTCMLLKRHSHTHTHTHTRSCQTARPCF
jgi:hypothetical protein